MRDTYSTQPKKDDIRTKLKSQGKPAGATIELGAVKPPPRKGFNIEEMNQTMRVPDRKNVETEQDEPAKRATTFDARQPVQTLPKDDEKSDLDRQSVQSPASPSWESQRAKVDFMKLRNNKNSVSPEQYKIGNNLVVNLADPIKKPSDVARMNQTSYNKGGKANFFPSTATATTNGSSGNGSQDPRRTTDSTRQPSQQNQTPQVDLNMQLRFGKNQIRLQGANKPQINPEVVSQTTKNAWQAVDLSGQVTQRNQPQTSTHQQQQVLFQTTRANQNYINSKMYQ